MPTNLRVKRDDGGKAGVPAGVHKPKKPVAPQYSSGLAPQQVMLKICFELKITSRSVFILLNFSTQVRPQPSAGQMRAPPKEKKTKDDAYADFMKEMQDLL